jgi:glucokinase-like ROK family protein
VVGGASGPEMAPAHHTLTCQVQKSRKLPVSPYDPTVDATRPPGEPASPASLSDDPLATLALVLRHIRTQGPRSRAELVSRTGLTRAIVAQRVSELLQIGLVTEGEFGPSTGGRPPRRVAFRADAGHVLVADLGATSIDVAVTDLEGRILAHHDEPADVSTGPEHCLSRIEELFEELISTTHDLPGWLWGVGIGVPGPVEVSTGRPVSPPIMPGWDGYPVRERMTDRYGAPVWVDNDVNIIALGEWRAGIAVGHDNVVVVKIGTGIGAGIISNGRIHRGAQGAAGDVGHIQVLDGASIVCRCGNVSCLEALAGGAALARDGEAAAASGRSGQLRLALEQHGRVTAEDVAHAASFGDPVARDLLLAAGHHVGLMLASIVNFFNPSLVVVAGGVAQSGDQLLAAIRETVFRRSLPLATRELIVQRSSLGTLAGVIGASTMVLDQLFSRDSLAGWLAERRPVSLVAGDRLRSAGHRPN